MKNSFCVLEKQVMENFCHLISFHINFSCFEIDQVIQKLQSLK